MVQKADIGIICAMEVELNKISEAMDEMMAGKTSFIVAHRLSTVQNADKILVMNDGAIVESGKHDELLEKGGFYAKIYMSQFAV